jgi:hypothetical protein
MTHIGARPADRWDIDFIICIGTEGRAVYHWLVMPMELQIIRAQEFIRLGAKGHYDMKASKAVLAQLGAACWKRGINQALLDLRALHPGPKPVFSPNDLVMLVNTFCKVGFTHELRLALLYGSDPHHRARLFAFIAKLRGWKVQAFDNFEAAVMWLSAVEEPQVETEFTPKAKKVPVRQLHDVLAAAKPVQPPNIIVKAAGNPRRGDSMARTGQAKSSSAPVTPIVRKIPAPPVPRAVPPR